ncbi:hypothetical protein WDZ92_30975, partial [Nostoc sp. NIES-2111]
MQILDTRNISEVVSVSTLQANIGPGRDLIVASGIALIEWKYDSDETAYGETRVKLNLFARNLVEHSAFAALASIANNESAFVFATDQLGVSLDPDTGELLLDLKTALMGEWSALSRIAYQVVMTIDTSEPAINGTIKWRSDFHDPDLEGLDGLRRDLRVVCNRYDIVVVNGVSDAKLTPIK